MAAKELRINNQAAYFRKAISEPLFGTESVLARDPFQYARLWLSRKCKEALPFWTQAENYYQASKILPLQSSPLTSYYCFLNAAKALLTVKGQNYKNRHGISGDHPPESKRVLSNEIVTIKSSGIVSSLSKYLQEPEISNEHNLSDLLGNMPFIHRAYRQTFTSKREMFIPVKNPIYRVHPKLDCVWLSCGISGRYDDGRVLKTLPSSFEIDQGVTDRCTVRTKSRAKWKKDIEDNNLEQISKLHKKSRIDVCYIAAPLTLWYLKRKVSGSKSIKRYGLTMIMAAMHRLSELSRYDPAGLASYLDGQPNWLLTEFIELSPNQFIDELVCEMTSLELRSPGVRP